MIIVFGDTPSSVEINAGERIEDPSKMAAAQYVGSNRQRQSMGRLPIYVYAQIYITCGKQRGRRSFYVPINFVSPKISSRLIGKEGGCFGPLLKRLERRGRGLTSWEPVPSLMDLKYIHLSTVYLFNLSG